jgi:hypothetical protein
MILSWNEIATRAKRFSNTWKDAGYERGETQSFYNDFFDVFGRRRRDVAVYERAVSRLNNNKGFIDLFWKGTLLVEQKSEGRNLDKALVQAEDYFLNLDENDRPRYILVSDFQNFEFLDLEKNQLIKFKLKDFHKNIKLFDFIAGRKQETYTDQDPVNIKAAQIIGKLFESIKSSGFNEKDLEIFLTRIVYCLFAEDTGIFQPNIFRRYLEEKTNIDGSDVGSKLTELFQIMDTKIENRQSNLDEDLHIFPYINGDLFSEDMTIPSLTSEMRKKIINCCSLDWSKVSPALFGSLFQTVLDINEQRDEGAHYTSEKNILKTIKPLFLDYLYAKLQKLKDDRSTQKISRLKAFHEEISKLNFLDPACGCGNFLIVAYRELRVLEIEVFKEIYPSNQLQLDVNILSSVTVDQFYGVELNHFAVRIAKIAMWLVDHQMNQALSDLYGISYTRIPIHDSGKIIRENALTYDWKLLIDPKDCNYILGNPPFVGPRFMTSEQKDNLLNLFSGVKGNGDLDFVSCWFLKASNFIDKSNTRVAFVSTNSITQGEQVGILWNELINNKKIDIFFAHRTFKWTIDEKRVSGMHIANVLVVIIGFNKNDKVKLKKIFDYKTISDDPEEIIVEKINPYLLPADNNFISKLTKQIDNYPEMKFGNMPVDGQNLLIDNDEYQELSNNQNSAKLLEFVKPFVGAREFISGKKKWCLWLKDVPPNEWSASNEIVRRVENVKTLRSNSKRMATKRLANQPYLFGEIRQPSSDFILIPRVSSSKREYIPIGFFNKDSIAGDSCILIPNGNLELFSILNSSVHMTWVKYICGRLKDDYRYSIEIVYNNFPFAEIEEIDQNKLSELSKSILEYRKNSGQTLKTLYDPILMPIELRRLHEKINKLVYKIYELPSDTTDAEIMSKLFELRNKKLLL